MAIDPRAFSDDKLTPPEPLPYVSRKALKRVKDALPPPETCPYCGPNMPVFLVNNSEIYGREYGEWPYAYLCEGCDSYVGVHPNTDIPLGTLATKDMREARKKGKAVFLKLRRRFPNRKTHYQWLADALGIPTSECHWGMFSIERAREAEAVCRQALLRRQCA